MKKKKKEPLFTVYTPVSTFEFTRMQEAYEAVLELTGPNHRWYMHQVFLVDHGTNIKVSFFQHYPVTPTMPCQPTKKPSKRSSKSGKTARTVSSGSGAKK